MLAALDCVHFGRCARGFLVMVLLLDVQTLAQDSWTGKQIMPKSEAGVLDIKSGNVVLGKTHSPMLTVLKVSGDWQQIREGGIEGWVARGEVVLVDNALEYFTGVIQQNPRASWAYLRRGYSAMVQSKTDAALNDLTEAIRLDPTNVVAFYDRGIAWNQKLEYDKAIADFTQAIRLHSVEVSLPKFKTSAEFSLGGALESLGMRLPFDRQHADFSAMTTDRSALAIAAVEHQAFVDVNEEGTEAAAATAVVMAPGTGAIPRDQKQAVFRADHPFLYLIRENSTGSILFIGRVSKPRNN